MKGIGGNVRCAMPQSSRAKNRGPWWRSPRSRPVLVAVCVVVLASCASVEMRRAVPGSITKPISSNYTQEDFIYCGGNGCKKPRPVSFSDAQLDPIRQLFHTPAADATAERDRIAKAIALLEVLAGEQAGTLNDRGGTLLSIFRSGQIDCYSEASNTTNFLGLMERDGLFRFHRVSMPRMRGPGFTPGGWLIHATAVIEETTSGQFFVVDSWFFDNGRPAVTAPLEDWLGGWRPQGGARL